MRKTRMLIGCLLVIGLAGGSFFAIVQSKNHEKQVAVSQFEEMLQALDALTVEAGSTLRVSEVLDQRHAIGLPSGDYQYEISEVGKPALNPDDTLSFNQLGPFALELHYMYLDTDFFSPYSITVKDTVAPELSGIKNYSITAGESLDYTSSVAAFDGFEGTLIPIFTGPVDLGNPGEYIVSVSAADQSGNTSTQSLTITVNAKPAVAEAPVTPTSPVDTPNNTKVDTSGDLATALAAVNQAILADTMTDTQKANAIYTWMQNTLSYKAGPANSLSITVNAANILSRHRGQCQEWAALSASLLTQAGLDIIYIDGEGSSNDGGYTYHAWVKVKIAGTYLHFDPLYGKLYRGLEFNQVTSAFLYANHSHRWDTGKYGS